MLLSQTDINAVLREAEAAVQQLAAAHAEPADDGPGPDSSPPAAAVSERTRRILRLTVPVVVRLAHRRMKVSEILRWGRGSIVEFGKHVEEDLDLLVNNHRMGSGEAVKIGEKFGLRISALGAPGKAPRGAAELFSR